MEEEQSFPCSAACLLASFLTAAVSILRFTALLVPETDDRLGNDIGICDGKFVATVQNAYVNCIPQDRLCILRYLVCDDYIVVFA